MRRDNAGLYAFASGSLWSDAARERELRAFVRLGEAEDRIHDIRRYVGAGVVFSAPVARLIEDQFGLAVAVAVALAEPGAVQRRVPMRLGRESIVELTYRHVLAENLNLQADVQYIRYPGFDITVADEWIFCLRIDVGVELLR